MLLNPDGVGRLALITVVMLLEAVACSIAAAFCSVYTLSLNLFVQFAFQHLLLI